jgi:membrane protein involved in D-alanine export
MLPFSTYEFLIIMAMFVAVLWICKFFVAGKYYKYILAGLNALFLIVVFPQPGHFLSLIGYSWLMIFLLTEKFVFQKKIWGIILLLLPMLLVKFDIRFSSYPFKLNEWISFAGLSYASFKIVGYYMDKAPKEKMTDVVTWFNFLSFTPTLLIGPIERLSRFKATQDNGFNLLNAAGFMEGWNVLIKGIAFKYVFAEIVDRYWLGQFAQPDSASLGIFSEMYAYYFYLFFDFAGYSFMALGIGRMMGIIVPVNFTNPFLAMNPQEFWRTFHISLGDWLKDYFFTPLYMFLTRKKSLKPYPLARQNAAMLLTFTLMGCWNGFKGHYILSGLLFGIYSAAHNTYVVECKKKGRDIIFGNMPPKLVKMISVFLLFNCVAIALYIFSGRSFI